MKKGIVVGVLAVVLMGLGGMASADVMGIYMFNVTGGYFTSGDTPGFPLTISQPGSYKLMENITVPDANKTAIEVKADNVTIDLNGFSIVGPTVCTYITHVCGPTGTGDGIYNWGLTENLKVTNGTIQGMGRVGINGSSGIIESVRAISNGSTGIFMKQGTIINSMARVNGGNGMVLQEGTVSVSTASFNGSSGILLLYGTVSGSTGSNNKFRGIAVTQSGTVTGSTASSNEDNGIEVGRGTVSSSAAGGNFCNGIWVSFGTVSNNSADNNVKNGIEVGSGMASTNTSANNQGYGLSLGADAGYINNQLAADNDAGFVNGGVNLGNNLCGNALCP
jgi:hypothetical protein